MTTPAARKKNRFGANVYPIPRPGTTQVEELVSVTSMLDVIAKPGLEKWRQEIIATQFALRSDLIMLAANPDTRKDAIKQALNATFSAANVGTSIHFFSELIDTDCFSWELVPDVAKPWIDNYLQGREDHQWELVDKEFSVYSFENLYAGTADRFLRIPGYEGVVIADLKTGKSVFGDHGLQMAMYAFAEGIWVAPVATPKTDAAMEELARNISAGTNVPPKRRGWSQAAIKACEADIQEAHWEEYSSLGQHKSMPEDLRKDVAFVMHLREDKFELIPLDISGLEPVVAGVAHLNRFTKRRNIVGDPLKSARQFLEDANAILFSASEATEELVIEPVKAEPVDMTVLIADAPVEQDQPLEPATEIPIAPPAPRPVRIKVFRDRIGALPAEAKQKLAFNWPTGTPTFKQSNDQSEEQLEELDKLLWEIESQYTTPEETSVAVRVIEDSFPGSSAT